MMTGRIGPILLALGILCATCAWAQYDTGTPDNTAPTQPGPQPAFTYPDATPTLDFLTGAIENSSLTLGVGTGFSYDSNAYGISTGNKQGRWLFHVTPSIRIQQFFPKFSWRGNYSGGLQLYTNPNGSRSANNNLFSQNAGGGFLWQMSRYWQLSGDDSFRYSADPFESYLTNVGTPTLNNPNPVTYTPLTQFTTNNAVLTASDRLSKVDTLAFTGTENYRSTSTYNLVTSVPFYNLVSYGGRASYSHQFSARLTLGADYNYNSLDFGHGQQRSGIQTISGTVDYLLRPNMSVSGWIGPEYTQTKTESIFGFVVCGQLICHNSAWSTAGGVIFAWHSLRNSVRAGYTRQVSDGGGIIATSQVNSVNGSYRRLITRKLDASISAQYYHDVSTTTSSRSFDNYYINAGLNYQVLKSLGANVIFGRVHQTQSNAFIIGTNSYDDNRVSASLTYSWTHPLGR
jgi:hypothetical protein